MEASHGRGQEELGDDQLIEQVLGGDDPAYEILLRRHQRRVYSIARHFFRSPETVEDIVQETFAKAYFSLERYRGGATFEQWVARIAVNNCYDELRRRKKRGESLLTDLAEDEQSYLEMKMARPAFEIHHLKQEREKAAEIVTRILERLGAEDQLVLTLLHCEDYSVREISEMTGWSEAKVKIRAFRARHAMRRALIRLNLSEERKSKS
jgi:RNA polymerase sigma-70 factor (ECF subfamily)